MSDHESDAIERQLKSMNNRSLAVGGLGLVLQMGGAFPGELGIMLRVAGTVLLVIGLSFYARMRGHSAWLCLLGLFSCLGALVLALLPKHCFNCRARIRAPWCSNCGAPAPK